MNFFRLPGAFIAAVLVLAVAGTITQSLFVLAALSGVGASISPGEAAGMILADLAALGPVYAALIALALLIAFSAGGVVRRLTGLPRTLVFCVAGLAAMAVMLLAMEQVFFGSQPIAGARTLSGFAAQMLAGLLAGFTFAALSPQPRQGMA